jgi:SET domain-containing protein
VVNDPNLFVDAAGVKGRGLFAARPFAVGERVVPLGGAIRTTAELQDDEMALQIGPERWLCSAGEHLDDFANHSCEPNVGFLNPDDHALYALRTIAVGEEIVWDYSTSIDEPEWDLKCHCGSAGCRRMIRPWHALSTSERLRLLPIAMGWLRDRPDHECATA